MRVLCLSSLRLSFIRLSFVFCVTSVFISGCGDDEAQVTTQRGLGPGYRNRASAPQQQQQGKQMPGQDISQRVKIPLRLKRKELLNAKGWDDFRRIRDRIKRVRDPFTPDLPEMRDQEEVEVDPSSVQRRLVVKVPENPKLLKFKGTLTGMESNLAMLEDGSGKGYNVRVGDIIGKPPVFVRVSMITSNRIVFEPVLGISADEVANNPMLSKQLRDGSEENTGGAR